MKHNCRTCEFWEPTEAVQEKGSRVLHDASKPKIGLCRLKPPNVQFFAVQGLDGRPQMQQQQYYPATKEGEGCSKHPGVIAENLNDMARHFIKLWNAKPEPLDYHPGKHSEAMAGFSRAPTLAEAKQISDGPHKDTENEPH